MCDWISISYSLYETEFMCKQKIMWVCMYTAIYKSMTDRSELVGHPLIGVT